MIDDFRRRFWLSLVLTVPIVALSPMLQHWAGVGETLRFPGDLLVLFALSSVVFFYGGWPFLTGLVTELKDRRPGMMTLISVAITAAYLYSTAVVFGLPGETFFWELATLVVIMLLGHWIEMRSVLGASGALEALVRLLPATAHRLTAGGETEEVPVADLRPGDRVLEHALFRRKHSRRLSGSWRIPWVGRAREGRPAFARWPRRCGLRPCGSGA